MFQGWAQHWSSGHDSWRDVHLLAPSGIRWVLSMAHQDGDPDILSLASWCWCFLVGHRRCLGLSSLASTVNSHMLAARLQCAQHCFVAGSCGYVRVSTGKEQFLASIGRCSLWESHWDEAKCLFFCVLNVPGWNCHACCLNSYMECSLHSYMPKQV